LQKLDAFEKEWHDFKTTLHTGAVPESELDTSLRSDNRIHQSFDAGTHLHAKQRNYPPLMLKGDDPNY
jgi:hypothetical protein